MTGIKSCLAVTVFFFSGSNLFAQTIKDPCFTSVSPIGFFKNSDDIINLCKCSSNFLAADLIEWDGSEWQGRLISFVELPPPEGCNVRGMWLGNRTWTPNGEAIALRLDKPLKTGVTYTYTFTYGRDGNHPSDNTLAKDFSPIVYTDKSAPSLYNALMVGRLPGTIGWTTQSFSFKAIPEQEGHEWLILHGLESAGTILSKCVIDQPFEINFLANDTTLCQGKTLLLKASLNDKYSYHWNTGDNTSFIMIQTPGLYSVEIVNYKCNSSDSLMVSFEDCELRFEMPNIFTPNGDEYNPIFIPKEYNFIESGILFIYNRWGERIFSGNLLHGWDGSQASSGIYYYDVKFTDRAGLHHVTQGTVTLFR